MSQSGRARLWTGVAFSAGFALLALGASAQAQGVSDAQLKAFLVVMAKGHHVNIGALDEALKEGLA